MVSAMSMALFTSIRATDVSTFFAQCSINQPHMSNNSGHIEYDTNLTVNTIAVITSNTWEVDISLPSCLLFLNSTISVRASYPDHLFNVYDISIGNDIHRIRASYACSSAALQTSETQRSRNPTQHRLPKGIHCIQRLHGGKATRRKVQSRRSADATAGSAEYLVEGKAHYDD